MVAQDGELDVMAYLLLDITTGVIAASLPVLSILIVRMQKGYLDYRSSNRKGWEIPRRSDEGGGYAMSMRRPERALSLGAPKLMGANGSDGSDVDDEMVAVPRGNTAFG